MSSKMLNLCCVAMINIFNKVTKEDVDKSRPDTALLYLYYEVTLKANQEKFTNLELTFKGMRDEESIIIITSDDLQSMASQIGMIHKNIYLFIFFYDHTDKMIDSTAPFVSKYIDPLSQKEIPNDLLC